jgi:hypothetical protein
MKKSDTNRFDWPELRALRPIPPSPPPTQGVSHVAPLVPLTHQRGTLSTSQMDEPPKFGSPQPVSIDPHASDDVHLHPSGAKTSRAAQAPTALSLPVGAPLAQPPRKDAKAASNEVAAAAHKKAEKPGAGAERPGPWHWHRNSVPPAFATAVAAPPNASPKLKPKKPKAEPQPPKPLSDEPSSAPGTPELKRRMSGIRTRSLSNAVAPKPAPQQPVSGRAAAKQVESAAAAAIRTHAETEAKRIARSLAKITERKRQAQRILADATAAETTLMRVATQRFRSKATHPTALALLAPIVEPRVRCIQTAMRARISVLLATRRKHLSDGDNGMGRSMVRVRPTALDPFSLGLDEEEEDDDAPFSGSYTNASGAVRHVEVQTPLGQHQHPWQHAPPRRLVVPLFEESAEDGDHVAHPSGHSSEDDYHGTYEHRTTLVQVGSQHRAQHDLGYDDDDDEGAAADYDDADDNRDDGLLDTYRRPQRVATGCDIPDESGPTMPSPGLIGKGDMLMSPVLDGQAVASMIELFDTMYDAETFELNDFATPLHTKGSRMHHVPSEMDSMAFEAAEGSPTQARMHDEIAGSSLGSPLGYAVRR